MDDRTLALPGPSYVRVDEIAAVRTQAITRQGKTEFDVIVFLRSSPTSDHRDTIRVECSSRTERDGIAFWIGSKMGAVSPAKDPA